MSNKAHKKELKNINDDIDAMAKKLIKQLKSQPLDTIDLYYYINVLNVLKVRKNKIMTLIALDYQ